MSTNRSVSSASTQSNSILDGQRDPRNLRAISPDRISAISSESETSVDNLEEGFVKKSHPRLQRLTAVVPPRFKESQPSSTSTAFQRWKEKQRRPIPKLLSFALTATIAVMLVFAPRHRRRVADIHVQCSSFFVDILHNLPPESHPSE